VEKKQMPEETAAEAKTELSEGEKSAEEKVEELLEEETSEENGKS